MQNACTKGLLAGPCCASLKNELHNYFPCFRSRYKAVALRIARMPMIYDCRNLVADTATLLDWNVSTGIMAANSSMALRFVRTYRVKTKNEPSSFASLTPSRPSQFCMLITRHARIPGGSQILPYEECASVTCVRQGQGQVIDWIRRISCQLGLRS